MDQEFGMFMDNSKKSAEQVLVYKEKRIRSKWFDGECAEVSRMKREAGWNGRVRR